MEQGGAGSNPAVIICGRNSFKRPYNKPCDLYLRRPCRDSPTRQKLSMPQIRILALEASTRIRNDATGRHGQCVHMQYTAKSLAPAA